MRSERESERKRLYIAYGPMQMPGAKVEGAPIECHNEAAQAASRV
jgi:hypothetical protein